MHNMGRNRNVVSICQYQVVFCPKYRRKVLTPPVDKDVKVILAEQIARWGQERIALEVLPDQVQLLVGYDPQFGLHRLVQLLKGSSSPAWRVEVRAWKRRLPSLWTTSYLVATVGGATLETLKRPVGKRPVGKRPVGSQQGSSGVDAGATQLGRGRGSDGAQDGQAQDGQAQAQPHS